MLTLRCSRTVRSVRQKVRNCLVVRLRVDPCFHVSLRPLRKSLAIDWILFIDRMVVGVALFMGSRELALPNPSLTRQTALVMTYTKEYFTNFCH